MSHISNAELKCHVHFLTHFATVEAVVAYYRNNINAEELKRIIAQTAEKCDVPNWRTMMEYFTPTNYNEATCPGPRSSASVLNWLYDTDTEYFHDNENFESQQPIIDEAYQTILTRVIYKLSCNL